MQQITRLPNSLKAMHTHSLICHPRTANPPTLSITASVQALGHHQLQISYSVSGALALIDIPPTRNKLATDGLWEHTCFEAFISQPDSSNYVEFNFSPSGQWAAYAFSTYRQRLPWEESQTPEISLTLSGDTLTLTSRFACLLAAPTAKLEIGLSCVIEHLDHSKSYWALAHPREQPDFHDRAAFTLPLLSL